ncbi:MAG TPA: efflux RND transporter periplasmic adaptor subunit [Steroidobacteraceae bacterium]|nr:efflux RND transporter periplasmic adaptor subunit [Steroidobacteraceae bacterium]
MKSIGWRLIIVLAVVIVLVGGAVAWNMLKAHFIRKAMAQNASPPQTVSTATAEYSAWQPEVRAVGSLRAIHGVEVTTEVAGLVRDVDFKSGSDARAGQTLVQLNADPDIAQLQALTAEANLAALVYHRDLIQYQAQAISRSQLDTDSANLKSTREQEAAQAALVAKKTIRAPFAGRLGITTLNPGQYLNPGDPIVTLESVDPIYVDFHLPQDDLSRVAVGQTVHVTTDAFPGRSFDGKIASIDPLVDPSTRNFEAEAVIGNPEHELLPGMFVRTTVDAGAKVSYLTLPQTAVTYNPYGETVYLVRNPAKPGGHPTAELAFVTPGPTRGDQVAIIKGLKAGDVVVSSGQMKIKNGTPLIVNNSVLPLDYPNPTPQEQ